MPSACRSELEPLYLQQVIGLSLAQIGLLGSFFCCGDDAHPMLSGKLADRYGERVPICGRIPGYLRGHHGILAGRSLPGFYFELGAVRSRGGTAQPGVPILISKVVPSSSLGAFTGVFYGSVGFFSCPPPGLGAQLWERFDPRLPFLITTMVSALTVIPTWLKFKLPDKPAATAAEEAA